MLDLCTLFHETIEYRTRATHPPFYGNIEGLALSATASSPHWNLFPLSVQVDYVGLGSDFDGIEVTPDGMEDISRFSRVLDEMRARGYSESDIEKVASGNFFRVMLACQ